MSKRFASNVVPAPAGATFAPAIVVFVTVLACAGLVMSVGARAAHALNVCASPCAIVSNDDEYSVTYTGTTVSVRANAAVGVLANDTGPSTTIVDLQDTPDIPGTHILTTLNGFTVSINNDGSFTYTADETFSGIDQFDYYTWDSKDHDNTDFATVYITILPVVRNDAYSVKAGQTLTVAAPGVGANDLGIEPTSIAFDAMSSNGGSVTDNANGGFSYTPALGFSGTDTFTYDVFDLDYDNDFTGTVTVFVTATVPDPPTLVSAAPGDGVASVSFAPPANNGGRTITSYATTCTSSNGGTTRSASGPAGPLAVSGLTNGKSYTCAVTATNATGTSVASAASNAFVPSAPIVTVPGAPTNAVATRGAGSASIAFSAPVNDGGAAISGYSVACVSSNGGATGAASGVGSPIAVSGLTNGKTYTCTVIATNAIGPSLPSIATSAFVPATVPDAPTNVVATRGAGSASVAFSAPVNDGGAAISGYSVTCGSLNGGATGNASGTSSPVAVTGLTTGKTYTCTVTATNVIGTSAASAVSNAFVTATVPDAPTNAVATGGAGSVSVAFSAPVNDGGAAISGYSVACVSSNGGASGAASGAASPVAVAGLTNGKTYTCTVTATNAVGDSSPSGASNAFVPATVPDAPTSVVATRGSGSASVAFSAPVNDGGAAISRYSVACVSSNGGASGAASGAASPVAVAGLTNGKTYTCTVTATNAVGDSSPSGASNAFVPATVPDAPTSVVATRGAGSASVAFSGPASDGGAAISTYAVACASSDGGASGAASGAASPVAVAGLTNGKTYTCTVTATNGVGTSAPSAASNAFAPGGCVSTCVGIGDAAIVEGNSATRALTFRVTLSAPSTTPVSVGYRVTGGTATVAAKAGTGVDVVAKASGTLAFKVGTNGLTPVSKTISVTVRGDTLVEGDETFSVQLTGATGGAVGRGNATGTVIDDEATPGFSAGVGDAAIVEGNAGNRSLVVPVTLSGVPGSDVVISYTVASGNAVYATKGTVPGADFGGKKSGTLTFKANGSPTRTISIPVWPDTRAEGDESLTVTIATATAGVSIARAVGTAWILDDD